MKIFVFYFVKLYYFLFSATTKAVYMRLWPMALWLSSIGPLTDSGPCQVRLNLLWKMDCLHNFFFQNFWILFVWLFINFIAEKHTSILSLYLWFWWENWDFQVITSSRLASPSRRSDAWQWSVTVSGADSVTASTCSAVMIWSSRLVFGK